MACVRGWSGVSGGAQRVHRDHAFRLDEVRDSYRIRLPSRRKAAALVCRAADAFWIRPTTFCAERVRSERAIARYEILVSERVIGRLQIIDAGKASR